MPDLESFCSYLTATQAEKLISLRILLIGAGGIGCEVLKNLALLGIKSIAVVDLDTIDVTNLNRQFLFQRCHVGKAKAIVAKESALKFNGDIQIEAYQADIKTFGLSFFKSFDVIINALDNADTRSYVNRICLFAERPIIESGTAGYEGQVNFIKKGLSCYDCIPRNPPKTFPVCTIRTNPSSIIHCVVWAKSYLLPALFGEPEDESNDNEDDDQELLKIQSSNHAELKTLLESKNDSNFIKNVFSKIFFKDVNSLVELKDIWINRAVPVPLKWKSPKCAIPDNEQNIWSVEENVASFVHSVKNLLKRNENVEFDKDDQDAMRFVSSAANIRAKIFHIPMESHFKIKSLAGNIIPAVATSNAIIAGFAVMQLFHFIKNDDFRITFLSYDPIFKRLLTTIDSDLPDPHCSTCRSHRAILHCRDSLTLQQLLGLIYPRLGFVDPMILHGQRLLYDSDFTANLTLSLKELDVVDQSCLLIEDSEEEIIPLMIWLVLEETEHIFKLIFENPNIKKRKRQEEEEDASDDKDIMIVHNGTVVIE